MTNTVRLNKRLNALNFNNRVNMFIQLMKKTAFSRLEAYDICHQEFVKAIKSGNFDYDNLALNLYAFLASYGMVCRGNVMLQHNYKYLIEAVKVICDKKYRTLLDIDVLAVPAQNYISLVLDLKEELAKKLKVVADKHDTLLSKIMLGSLGCVIAYDFYVCKSLGKLHICKKFSKRGLDELLTFIKSHDIEIRKLQSKYNALNYSVMKLTDCVLWRP